VRGDARCRLAACSAESATGRRYQPPPEPDARDGARRRDGRDGARRRGRDRDGGPRRASSTPLTDAERGLREAERTGLSYAIRTAPDRDSALEVAAVAIERRLVGPATTSQRTTVAKLLAAVEALTDAERAAALAAANVRSDQVLVSRLDLGAQRRLARALRNLIPA
jgi:hypothetical protein